MHVVFKAVFNTKILFLLLTIFVVSCWIFASYKRESVNRFNKVIVFGDSFSYTGNDNVETDIFYSTVTHRYQDRYCDGLVWIERLNVPETHSYALPGATSDNEIFPSVREVQGVSVPSVRQQIATYVKDARKNQLNITEPLYVIWVGFNDFYRYRTTTPKVIVKGIMKGVEDLLNAGAINLLIFNQPPLQAFPCYQHNNRAEFYAEMTTLFNVEYSRPLAALKKKYPNAALHLFNFHALLTKIVSNKASRKFTNTVDPCWDTMNTFSPRTHCRNPREYVFVDIVHFTSTVHQLIADAIQPFLSTRYRQNALDSYIYSF